eukprot:357077-Chlamydomonas_euryale.AAC.4
MASRGACGGQRVCLQPPGAAVCRRGRCIARRCTHDRAARVRRGHAGGEARRAGRRGLRLEGGEGRAWGWELWTERREGGRLERRLGALDREGGGGRAGTQAGGSGQRRGRVEGQVGRVQSGGKGCRGGGVWKQRVEDRGMRLKA